MDIEFRENGNVLRIVGDMRISVDPAREQRLLNAAASVLHRTVILDLSGLERIDSLGIGLLARLRSRWSMAGVRVRVCLPQGIAGTALAHVRIFDDCDKIQHVARQERYEPFAFEQRALSLADDIFSPPPSTPVNQLSEAGPRAGASGANRRVHTRVPMKTGVRIRRGTGSVEVTVSVNVSRGGFAFSSSRDYLLREPLRVILHFRNGQPVDPTGERGASVVRRVSRDTSAFEYGVKFE